MSGRGRICFNCEYLFPLLGSGPRVEFAGGAETQQLKLARGLQARGFDVSIVTCDFGQPERLVIDGILVLRSFRLVSPIPVVRFFHPRLTRSIAALRRADAEVYYVNGSGVPSGITFDMARSRRAGFVLHVASDYEVIASLPRQPSILDRVWYRRALKQADLRIAQTEAQGRSLRLEFGLDSQVLHNVVEIPAHAVDSGQDGTVVWLGTYKDIKRPQWFTDLAREFPDRRFVMAGVIPPPPLTREHWGRAQEAANRTPNLSVRGFVDPTGIAELFAGASLLVHTSPVEGFSNVMLEAWSCGLPTVSAVDPDALVTRQGLGALVSEYPQLVREVGRLLSDPEARRAAGARARSYVTSNHAPDMIYDRLSEILDRVVAHVRKQRAGRRLSAREPRAVDFPG
ncbi:MAG: glycosyltransferase family 4 protein [Candidatus Eisenbacteria bacterium]|nr:glycosyltransferase family 4 protein [Candidatus Eisenbacteria bacterium]